MIAVESRTRWIAFKHCTLLQIKYTCEKKTLIQIASSSILVEATRIASCQNIIIRKVS